MIYRYITDSVTRGLANFPAVGLLGPRQVGKTTLARRLEVATGMVYLDMENPNDAAKLSDPHGYLALHQDKLVIVDEVQRMPGLFQSLRGIIDDRVFSGRSNGHFLLLGSASIDLLRQSSETLAGRIAYYDLPPLQAVELAVDDLSTLWVRGGFPRSVLSASDAASMEWRNQFISTYLERDVPNLGPRIPATTLRRFWTMLAHHQSGMIQHAELARSLAVDNKTIANYLDLMCDLLLVRRLEPFHSNIKKRLVKSPKYYVRDSGLLHALLRIPDMERLLEHPIVGASWEGFAIETIINAAPPGTAASFYRTATGVEIDLVLELPNGDRWAIEIKRGIAPKLSKGFYIALDDLNPTRTFVVCSSDERYRKCDNVEVISVRDLALDLLKLA